MAKIHALKRRIKSIRSIYQMTKAMELVAASKLRRTQEVTLQSRLYTQNARQAAQRLADIAHQHPLCQRRGRRHRTLVVFSSDRGLAGAYHANLFRKVLHLLESSPELPTDVIAVGQKAAQFMSRLTSSVSVTAVYTNWPAPPLPLHTRPAAVMIKERFIQGATDEVVLVYTEFLSLANQRVTAETLLPFTLRASAKGGAASNQDDTMLFEPSPQQVIDYIIPLLVELQLLQASLEASASEQAMRMRAMKNASDNAEDLTADLALLYNSARQSAVTQELAEITAGAEAMA